MWVGWKCLCALVPAWMPHDLGHREQQRHKMILVKFYPCNLQNYLAYWQRLFLSIFIHRLVSKERNKRYAVNALNFHERLLYFYKVTVWSAISMTALYALSSSKMIAGLPSPSLPTAMPILWGFWGVGHLVSTWLRHSSNCKIMNGCFREAPSRFVLIS